ncbi:MAG TPA: proteasome ATPase [Nitrospiria bacterium]|nr:proteasome ATPase [Nitrospiria bacterium]
MAEGKKGKLNPFRSTMKKLSDQISGSDLAYEKKLEQYESEIHRLEGQICAMEEDLRHLHASRVQLDQAYKQNEKLVSVIHESKEQIAELRKEIEKLTAPPAAYAVFSAAHDDGTVDVFVSGRKMKVNVHPQIQAARLKKGQQLILNDAMNVIEVGPFELQGEVVKVKDVLEGNRIVVSLHADEERVAELADPLFKEKISVGDHILLDPRSGYLLEKLPKSEIEEVVLEEIPDTEYGDIGGLKDQIGVIQDSIELPYLYPELFSEHHLTPPKGILLYGPPGCGKTLIAKAVAHSISKRAQEKYGKEVRSFFLHVKGPELLNKYVGESERHIREVFKKAKEKAQDGLPVVVFFDEMDSLFRTRGSGVSSDMESTIVPQFLSEIDGIEKLRNVIVIGASNRQDLIDPAILRPGRLDIKIKVERPNRDAAKDIFAKYLTSDLPFHEETLRKENGDRSAGIRRLIDDAVDFMYRTSEDNKFLEVTYANGEKETLYFKDFSSGAMIEGVVSRAKRYAIKRMISIQEKGIKLEDLIQGMRDEFKENEDLPNTTNPDDWAKIAARKSEKIIHVRTLGGKSGESRRIENVSAGHYL